MEYFSELYDKYPAITFLIHFLIICTLLFGINRLIKGRLKNASQTHPRTLIVYQLLEKTLYSFLFLVAFHLAYANLDLPPAYDRYERIIFWTMAGLQIFLWVNVIIMGIVQYIASRKALEGAQEQFILTAGPVRLIVQALIASIILIIVLGMLGVNVTGLVAGLGVGGIALALAVQNTLKDLLSALSIALNKPFVPGDFVVLGDKMGTIQKIGLQTTTLLSLSGEQLTLNNNDILSSRIQNFARMETRRIEFRISTDYQTSAEKAKNIPEIIKEIITPIAQTRLERAHFKEFGESGLVFETVYWVLTPDFNLYMDIQQQINLELMIRFQKEDIRFATPFRTVQIIDNTPKDE